MTSKSRKKCKGDVEQTRDGRSREVGFFGQSRGLWRDALASQEIRKISMTIDEYPTVHCWESWFQEIMRNKDFDNDGR